MLGPADERDFQSLFRPLKDLIGKGLKTPFAVPLLRAKLRNEVCLIGRVEAHELASSRREGSNDRAFVFGCGAVHCQPMDD
jgi:hypothetical protein